MDYYYFGLVVWVNISVIKCGFTFGRAVSEAPPDKNEHWVLVFWNFFPFTVYGVCVGVLVVGLVPIYLIETFM